MRYERLNEAVKFCVEAHGSQERKYIGIPYCTHPIAVMELVRTVTDDEDVLCAAVLHDVVEDTPATINDVELRFGQRVADLVGWLTDVSKPSDGNRATRKAIDREHIARSPADAQTIKLADLIHNTDSIVNHDPDFAKVYLKEKARLLGVLTKGDDTLRQIAAEQIT